jgi:hypothetical protein
MIRGEAAEHQRRMAAIDAKWDRRQRLIRWLPLGVGIAVFGLLAALD